eukprot:TRINITY_DN6028_c0_g1_i1.p1 TRINITY_DN6028_c0_g1~~TRINITY_DN6028_c0_g1_i1.p1  ORF type:complete len:635 (-),score=118.77 TRINITY_DN6028_c0_g1_i1:1433-3337(-)
MMISLSHHRFLTLVAVAVVVFTSCCSFSSAFVSVPANFNELKKTLRSYAHNEGAVTFTPYDGDQDIFEMKVLLEYGLDGQSSCEMLSYLPTQMHRSLRQDDPSHVIVHSTPATRDPDHHDHDEDDEHDNHHQNDTMIVSIISRDHEAMFARLKATCNDIFQKPTAPGDDGFGADEIVALVKSGDPKNRIDVVLMGDGYTAQERTKFFSDMERMVGDMFQDVTFASYLPVFNIWALFRASTQSGIGVGGTPRNTAFGLYRDGTELRGIYCSKTSAARQACAGVGQYACDFPSLIANDAFYGGLGGEFTIGTSSLTTGTIVLRHEMGHNFGSVGEEYDGGSVYSGANSASSLTQVSQKWGAWLTEPSNVVQQQSVQRMQSYAWWDLARGTLRLTFTSDGQWNRAYLIFSVSGCETQNSLRVTMDGIPLNWRSTGVLDRQFYPFIFNAGFSSGTHVLEFTGTAPTVNQIRQVCNVNLHEYKGENLFKFDNSFIGAYPTWSSSNRLTYRPNNERCLMRNMTSPHFCAVCQENNWLQFFNRMSLIDSVVVSRPSGPSTVQVDLTVVPLAQFRTVPVQGERYTVKWTRNGVVDSSLANLFSFSRASNVATGNWVVEVQFQTPEVRVDTNKRLTATQSFTI